MLFNAGRVCICVSTLSLLLFTTEGTCSIYLFLAPIQSERTDMKEGYTALLMASHGLSMALPWLCYDFTVALPLL